MTPESFLALTARNTNPSFLLTEEGVVLAANNSGSAILGCSSLCGGQGIDLSRYVEGGAEGSPDDAFPRLMRAWASAGVPLSRPVRLRTAEGRPVQCRAEGLAVTTPGADGLSRVILHLVPAVGTGPLAPLVDSRAGVTSEATAPASPDTGAETIASDAGPSGSPTPKPVGKMEAMGNLAAGIAHDFNNLLTVMKVEVELILEDDNVPALAVDSLLSAHAAMLRAESLVDGLLAFSRRQLVYTSLTDLGALLEDAIPRIRGILGDMELVVEPTTDPLPLLVDAEQMEVVLLALTRNAMEASSEGSRVAIRTRRETLDETFVQENDGSREGEYAVLEVEDHGTGITPEVEARMFEPFFTTKGRGYGRGLGLAQAFGIVKKLGGYLKVITEVEKGSRFIVYLPLHDGSASG